MSLQVNEDVDDENANEAKYWRSVASLGTDGIPTWAFHTA